MGTSTASEPALTPIKFSRLTRRGILLGLSGPQLVVTSIASGTLILGLYLGIVVATFPIIGVLLALAFVGAGGRKLIEWAPLGASWLWRSAGGQLVYRRRIVKPRPAGTIALPGDAARLRQWLDPDTGAVMIHDPHAATLTAIVGVSHPAFVLLDPAEQERRVVAWGRVLATACRSGRLAAIQVSERTLPDSGKGLAQWWNSHGDRGQTWTSQTYAELIDRAGPAGERHASTISISLDMKAARRAIRAAGGGMKGAAAVLRQEMSTMEAALRSADLSHSQWLTPGDLAVILRSAYDPAVAGALERHGQLGRDLAAAGPIAVTESWGSLRTDSAEHCVLWISEWPRSLVFPGFLAPLLLSSGIRRTFTLLYSPMRTDRAARDIRKKKTEYISDAAQRQKIGQIEDAQQTAEYQDVLQQEADLTAGHGLLRAIGFVAVSASDPDELESAVAAVEQAAIQASCETRRLWGQQAQAFAAAALPLCRVM
ncbi:SCO6880 family protein [Nocardioides ultimimeridianus]